MAEDELPEGVGDVVVAAIDGLWLNWVLGLVQVDQDMIVRVRKALEKILDDAVKTKAAPKKTARSATAKAAAKTRKR